MTIASASFQNRRRQIAVNYYPKKKKTNFKNNQKKKKKIATKWTAELKDLLIKQNSQLAKYKLKWKAVEITLFSQSIKLTYCYMVNRSSFMKKEKKKKTFGNVNKSSFMKNILLRNQRGGIQWLSMSNQI